MGSYSHSALKCHVSWEKSKGLGRSVRKIDVLKRPQGCFVYYFKWVQGSKLGNCFYVSHVGQDKESVWSDPGTNSYDVCSSKSTLFYRVKVKNEETEIQKENSGDEARKEETEI